MFYILARKAIGGIGDLRKYARYASISNSSNNRYNSNGYGSLRSTTIACGLEALEWHGKKHGFFIHLHPS